MKDESYTTITVSKIEGNADNPEKIKDNQNFIKIQKDKKREDRKELINYRFEQIFNIALAVNMLFGVIGAVCLINYLVHYLLEQNSFYAKSVADSVIILIASGLPVALSFKLRDSIKLRLLNIAGLIFCIIYICYIYVPGE